ncbi:U3 small nucleolar RNA-associated protein 14 homolog A-like protein [Lates japonicus]|uniref:U3 small nucleolar RNA-associated protein 14 homolog A-like protein n=1 Tax=Lates japonicus TaxID=270547 RepID=A0AAD3R1I7_LATJO|nr:U3 small nucleolar RNA-associated protein 14 homolog A-like protein [Lates japonicus]
MAKVSKRNSVCKKKLKKGSEVTEKSAAVKPHVVYDDCEEEEVLNEADENITSEEEEDDNDERKRQKLLEAISALGGKRKKKLGERSEAAVQMSEFTVNAAGEGDKIDLSDLIGTMDSNPSVPAKTKKQLKNLQQTKKTIECPLSKQESERILRDVAFQKAATEVSRWKGIIRQNQRAEQLVFPLNQEPSGPKPIERVVTSWRAQTPLEQEIFALLSANKQPISDPILTPAEEASLRAMSLEDAKIRRAELQKARALQSYYEAKARRERKIKSKKYHKVHNKAKRKEFLKQFDEMVKTDPAAALEELNKMELARMQERMSLKHQNSGKWAKSKAIMAKYDEAARKAMQQQLEVNKDLTQKLVTSVNNEEEEEEEEASHAELMPDFVNDAEQGLDSSNPWMRGKLSEDPTEKEMSGIVDPAAAGAGVVRNIAEEEEDEEEVEDTEEEALLREFDSRRKLRHAQETDTVPVICVDNEEETVEENKAAAEDLNASDKEEEELSEFTSLFRGIAEAENVEAAADASHTNTSAQLEEGLMRIRTLEDVELLSEESATDKVPVQPQPPPATENLPSATQKPGKNKKRKRGIELQEALTREAKVIQVPLAPTVEDTENSDEKLDQRGLIKEAFAGDDVISDFLKDKRKAEDAGKPKAVDLTLPGWGEWGGTGLKPSRNKRRRFRTKTIPPPPRKDHHLPSVIISEKKNSSISLHQVNSLPFPFENHAQFESTIRSPMGRTWNTERTVKKITKPKVVTQLGAIIEPMAQEELMKDKKLVSAGNKSSVDSWKRKH